MSTRSLALSFALSALLVAPAFADELVLVDGRRLQGKVSVVGDQCRIEMKYGTQTFSMKEVAQIVRDAAGGKPDASAGEEASEEDDSQDDGKAGKDDGLPPEVELAPLDEGEKAALLAELGGSARYVETEHFAVASTADEEFTAERASLLESVRRGFYRFFCKKGFQLTRHPRRLEAVIFGDEQSYKNFARGKFPGASNAAGFYASNTNRLYLYDFRNSPQRAQIQAQLTQLEGKIEEAKRTRQKAERAGQRDYAKQLSGWILDTKRAIRKFRKDNREFLDDANDETTIHEATHQLCFNSDLLVPSPTNPQWLVEGLAMLFEDPGVWKGRYTKGANDYRIDVLARYVEAKRRLGLRDLVGSGTSLIARSDPDLAYATSWALTHLLVRGKFKKYKDKFFEYLKAVRTENRGGSPKQSLALFERAFGGLDDLDRELAGYVDDLIKKAD